MKSEYVMELEDGTELIAGPSHPVYVWGLKMMV